MQFPSQSLVRLPLLGAGTIPKRCQFNTVMCFWWMNKNSVTVPCVCGGSSAGNGTNSLPGAFWSSLNAAAPSPREAEEDRIPTGAPTHIPAAGMGCWEVPQTQGSKGHSPPAAAASVLPVAAQRSLKEFSKGKSSPAKPGEFHLHQELTRPSHQSSQKKQS